MKKPARPECSSRKVHPTQLEPQLRAYATLGAATTAVAGAVGATSVAEATPQDITDPSVVFNVPWNGVDSVSFTAGPFHGSFYAARNHGGSAGSISWGEFFSAAGLGGDRLLRLTGNIQVAALTAGAAIAGDFQAGFGLLGSATVENFPNPPGVHHTHLKAGFFGVAGPSAAATNYIGFKAYANSQTYYGWLRIKVQNGADGLPSQISLVAKDGEPAVFGAFGLASDNVLAGQSFGTAIPEPANVPGGLALLALGAAGVREFRKRRKSAA